MTVILSPLLGVIFSPLYAIPPIVTFINILFYIILDAGQKYLGIVNYIANHFDKKDIPIHAAVAGLLIPFSLGFYFQINHIWMIFFYIVLLHFLWQIDWFLTPFLSNNSPKILLRSLLQVSMISTICITHFNPSLFIALQYQEAALGIESVKFFNSALIYDSIFFLITSFYLIYLFLKQQITKKGMGYIISLTFFIRFIFYSPYLGGDPLFVIISMHALPYIFYNLKSMRSDLNIKRFSQIIFVTLLLAYIDTDFLIDNLDLDINYLDEQVTWYAALGSAFYAMLQLFHISCSYFLRKRMKLISDVANDAL